mmetsp:Transcript_21781/g.43687  ORF Transcript_21781/g.43687 Transcript_21781/m.43687 type:complete len:404 (-) Transcript_21781:205-1416(-)
MVMPPEENDVEIGDGGERLALPGPESIDGRGRVKVALAPDPSRPGLPDDGRIEIYPDMSGPPEPPPGRVALLGIQGTHLWTAAFAAAAACYVWKNFGRPRVRSATEDAQARRDAASGAAAARVVALRRSRADQQAALTKIAPEVAAQRAEDEKAAEKQRKEKKYAKLHGEREVTDKVTGKVVKRLGGTGIAGQTRAAGASSMAAAKRQEEDSRKRLELGEPEEPTVVEETPKPKKVSEAALKKRRLYLERKKEEERVAEIRRKYLESEGNAGTQLGGGENGTSSGVAKGVSSDAAKKRRQIYLKKKQEEEAAAEKRRNPFGSPGVAKEFGSEAAKKRRELYLKKKKEEEAAAEKKRKDEELGPGWQSREDPGEGALGFSAMDPGSRGGSSYTASKRSTNQGGS